MKMDDHYDVDVIFNFPPKDEDMKIRVSPLYACKEVVEVQTMTTFPPMPLLPITSPSTISACRELPLRPSDIFICSYPKSGTTWTQHIVLTLLLADRKYKIAALTSCGNSDAGNTGDDDLAYNHVSDYAPFFEIDAHWQSSPSTNSTKVLADSVRENHDRLGRRVFNTHLRWDVLPKQREVDFQFIRRGSSILGTVDNAQTLLIDQTIIELKLIDNCRAGGSDLCPFGLE